MRADSAALLEQARADACAARDAPTLTQYWGALRDCFAAFELVPADDEDAQTRIAVAREALTEVIEDLFASDETSDDN